MTQKDSTDIYRTFYPNTEEHTFFSIPHGTWKLQNKKKKTHSGGVDDRKIIKVRNEINEIEAMKTIKSINKTKSCFFEKIKKRDKPLSKLAKGQRKYPNLQKLKVEIKIET